jgi:hypothetical protein
MGQLEDITYAALRKCGVNGAVKADPKKGVSAP